MISVFESASAAEIAAMHKILVVIEIATKRAFEANRFVLRHHYFDLFPRSDFLGEDVRTDEEKRYDFVKSITPMDILLRIRATPAVMSIEPRLFAKLI